MSEIQDEDIITLTDENGNDVEFLLLDVVEYNNDDYMVMIPLDDEEIEDDDEQDEVVILKVIREGDEETYSGVEDEDVLKFSKNRMRKRTRTNSSLKRAKGVGMYVPALFSYAKSRDSVLVAPAFGDYFVSASFSCMTSSAFASCASVRSPNSYMPLSPSTSTSGVMPCLCTA